METDQSETIELLSRPAAYRGARGPVERVDTHAAVVFLVGERAYKLKRAVRYSYLDFSTVERRERYCRAEVALNRRTAPRLYLGARPVRRGASGRLAIGGRGTVVDWLVVMRRFDQGQLLDRLAARGGLDAAMMTELADRIAAFHGKAARVHGLGGRPALALEIRQNARNLALYGKGLFAPQAIRDLEARSRKSLAAVGKLLDARREAGDVRLCHGDLHLRNICLIDGVPTLFDGIEFNERLSCIDVLYDLAFLLMDLEHRGLRPLANAVLNRYLDRADQPRGLAALPLLLSIRAAIRAHVGAAAAAAQPSAATAEGLRKEAQAYLRMAHEFLEPCAPMLVAIGGLSGTGKSTLAYGLAPALGAAPGARVLRSDVIRKRLMGVAPEKRLPDSAYGEATTRRVYGRLEREAEAALKAGRGVVVDAVFARTEERAAMAAIARRLGAPFAGFWLEAPANELIRRIAGRRADASDATAEIVRRQLGYETGIIDWRRLDARGDARSVRRAAEKALAATTFSSRHKDTRSR